MHHDYYIPVDTFRTEKHEKHFKKWVTLHFLVENSNIETSTDDKYTEMGHSSFLTDIHSLKKGGKKRTVINTGTVGRRVGDFAHTLALFIIYTHILYI